MNTPLQPNNARPAEPTDIVRRIIQHIKMQNLKPGDRLPAIREFSQRWQIKGGLIRDALLRAQTLGVVRLQPRAGAFVKQFDYRQMADLMAEISELAIRHANPRQLYLYDARIVIESETFRRAASRHSPEDLHELQERLLQIEAAKERTAFVLADEQFHLTVARISGNPILATVLGALLAMLRPDRLVMQQSRRMIKAIHQEHRKMYTALLNTNPEQAAELASLHIGRMRQALLDRINQALKLEPAAGADVPHTT